MRVLVWGCCLVALAACGNKEEPAKQAMVQAEGEYVTLAEPDKASFLGMATVERDPGGILRLPGRLVWNETRTVRVFPQLAGRLTRLAVDVGQTVKIGQTLAELSSADYGQAVADASKAEADLAVAEKALVRASELRQAGIVAERDWQQAEADALRARAEAGRAGQRLQGLGGERAGAYALKAPLAGVVVERNVNPGMEYRPDQNVSPLFLITDPTSLWLQLDAAEADLAHLRTGEEVAIAVRQFPGERFRGVIRHVADFVDPQSRTVKVRCEVPNGERRLKAEMFVEAEVKLPASELLIVPAEAVMLQGDRRFVLVEEAAGRFRRQLVETGGERHGRVEVRQGLKFGDKVVSGGNLSLLRYLKPQADAAK